MEKIVKILKNSKSYEILKSSKIIYKNIQKLYEN